ncbi:MAG: cupin domain-containing protein [Pseudomonadota bacterium]
MPKIDINALPALSGTSYPSPYDRVVKGRSKKILGDAAGLDQFGVNLTRLAPGAASAHRHWHQNEDEFVFIVEGEGVLVEDDGETTLRAGAAAAFKAGVANGHQIVNRSERDVVFLEIGTRSRDDVSTYSDPGVDLQMRKIDGAWKPHRKNGDPFPQKDKGD